MATTRPIDEQAAWQVNNQSVAFVVLSFEGPDAYSQAGGLGTRVTGLSQSLAEAGFETHLFFIGAPELPGHEMQVDGRLYLHRWCQWISQYHPGGVYDAEEAKLEDWNRSLPAWLEAHLLPSLLEEGRAVAIMAEEWQTSEAVLRIDQMLARRGWKGCVRQFWNANNTFSFDRVRWPLLKEAATITTVSRFMKHQLWRWGVEARVVPNGLPSSWLAPPERRSVDQLRRLLRGRLTLAKIARWDPDKRWLMAVDAVSELKERGLRPLLLARGGMEGHGEEVLRRARLQGLNVAHAQPVECTEQGLCLAIASGVEADVDVLIFDGGLGRRQLQVLYRAADAVLSNSGVEPFGLVGLEAMASGGLVFVGATGEDYITGGHDGISLQTSEPGEIVGHLLYLRNHADTVRGMRRAARTTAGRYVWQQVLKRNLTPLLTDQGVPLMERRPSESEAMPAGPVRRGKRDVPDLLGPFGSVPSLAVAAAQPEWHIAKSA